jgi:hypothetical protein
VLTNSFSGISLRWKENQGLKHVTLRPGRFQPKAISVYLKLRMSSRLEVLYGDDERDEHGTISWLFGG